MQPNNSHAHEIFTDNSSVHLQCKNLKLYKDYVEFYRQSLKCLEKLKSESLSFKTFLEVCMYTLHVCYLVMESCLCLDSNYTCVYMYTYMRTCVCMDVVSVAVF